MATFSPVGPASVLQKLEDAGAIGNYMLMISSRVAENPKAYSKFTKPGRFIVMDNSVIEDGRAEPVEQVVLQALNVGADAIVLPDVLNSSYDTVKATEGAINSLQKLGLGESLQLVGVVQGSSPMEALICTRQLVALGVDYLAIPRCIADNPRHGTRTFLVDELTTRYDKPLLLLGFSDNLQDDARAARKLGVIGIDSAMPIWAGNQGHHLTQHTLAGANFGRRPDDYWYNGHVSEAAYFNVGVMSEWLR